MVRKKRVSKNVRKLREEKNRGFIYKNFLTAVKDLKKIKVYFWVSFWLFFGIGLIGFLFPVFFVEEVLKIVEELIKLTEGLGVFGMIRFIMANNIQSAFLGMALGVFLGVPSLVIIITNGYILGIVGRLTVDEAGILVLWRLLPHGIFEILAILIAVALGLRLGTFMFVIKNKSKAFLCYLISAISFLFLSGLSIILYSVVVLGTILLDAKTLVPLFFFIPSFLGIFILSLFIGMSILSKEEKDFVLRNLRVISLGSLRIFILVVVPLLVIAGVIEGILVGLLG